MATPRQPNARRGRPPKSFLNDADRNVIPIAMALQALGHASENASYLVVSVHALGRKVGQHVMASASRKRGIGEIRAGTTVTSYERVSFVGQTTTTFPGFASTLRRKKDRWMQQDAEAATWLRAMATLIALFLRTAMEDGGDLQQLVPFLCDLAHRAALNSHAPDYSPRVLAQITTYRVQQEAVPMSNRDFYASLSKPIIAAPDAAVARGPKGSPRNLSVIICEDEMAELIRMDPAALCSATRGQLATELAQLITTWMEARAA